MNIPTHGEARPVWRPRGDVETYAPQVSAAERAARARQAGAPESRPPVTLETARRQRGNGSAAPARREHEGAERGQPAAPSPRPASPPEQPPEKRGYGIVTAAIVQAIAVHGGPMRMSEIMGSLSGLATKGCIAGTVCRLKRCGVLVQDVPRGPYRLARRGQ